MAGYPWDDSSCHLCRGLTRTKTWKHGQGFGSKTVMVPPRVWHNETKTGGDGGGGRRGEGGEGGGGRGGGRIASLHPLVAYFTLQSKQRRHSFRSRQTFLGFLCTLFR